MALILVADDEEGLREFLAETLEGDGHSVVQAADGAAALTLLRERAFDLLVTDLKMPKLSGIELLTECRASQPELEVIVLTAHATVETAVEAMKLGAFDYMSKPISSPMELRLLARRALERRSLSATAERAERLAAPLTTLTWGAASMASVVEAVQKVAPTNATVLLSGESGTGKEVVAQELHRLSPRAKGPFVAVNCASLSEHLLESELFGHEKGAFTGAAARRRGRLELADGGTFFLDEVGELKPGMQAKLLRVLQDRRFERVGGSQTIEADVRWIAATNRDLKARTGAGEFREDLYHRLAVFPIDLPPLRERREDVPPLAELLLSRIGAELGRPELRLGAGVAAFLAQHPWPGNVRELANAIERAAILSDGETLERGGFRIEGAANEAASPLASSGTLTLEELEKAAIARALEQTDGNRRQTAELLGIGERTLYDKLRKYDLK